MNCPRVERWSEWVDGAMEARSAAALAIHLEGCVACRETVQRIRREGAALTRLLEGRPGCPSGEIPPLPGPDFVRRRGMGKGWVWALVGTGVAAVLVLVLRGPGGRLLEPGPGGQGLLPSGFRLEQAQIRQGQAEPFLFCGTGGQTTYLWLAPREVASGKEQRP